MYQSNAMLIGDLLFNDSGIPEMYQSILLPFWNACNFYISYANIDGFYPNELKEPNSSNQLDKWMLAELYEKSQSIDRDMSSYNVDRYVTPLISLINGLTNWYIRRSRRRFWGSDMTADKQSAYETLYYVLVNMTKLMAPVAPIISEMLYKTLTGDYSVHLTAWPDIPASYHDDELISQVDTVQSIITLARSIRNKNGIKNRQPLSMMKVAFVDARAQELLAGFGDTIAEELNVKNIEILSDVSDIAALKYDPNFSEIRSRYPDRVPEIIKAVKSGQYELAGEKAILTINGAKEEFDPEIILVTYQSKENIPVAGDRGTVVSLDLTITDELRSEGLARDIVRHVQEARKQMACDIMDRIKIAISGDYPAHWADYIQTETLSTIVNEIDALKTIEIQGDDGDMIVIRVSKT